VIVVIVTGEEKGLLGSRYLVQHLQWYREGYNTPKYDLVQKIDWVAAAKFNEFFIDS
jgi:Zn-dependent M28 family amino/carboxypeptidase